MGGEGIGVGRLSNLEIGINTLYHPVESCRCSLSARVFVHTHRCLKR